MTGQPIGNPALILRGTIQVAASVPYLLGFEPSESVVAVFAARDGQHVLTARIDLDDATPASRLFSDTFAMACMRAGLHGASRACFILYPTVASTRDEIGDLTHHVELLASSMGIAVDGVASVSDGVWRDELDPCVEPVVIAAVGLDAAAQWVAHGATYEPSREHLAARIRGPETSYAHQIREYIRSQPGAWRRDLTRSAVARRRTEDRIFSHISVAADQQRRCDWGSIDLPEVSHAAAWAISLKDNRVREPVLWRLAQRWHAEPAAGPDIDDRTLAAMCLLLRNVPHDLAAPLASCVAAYAWQCGNGALAGIAADHGLTANPNNVLCGLVAAAVTQGAHPNVWVDMLRSMTIKDLRAGSSSGRRASAANRPRGGVEVRDCPG